MLRSTFRSNRAAFAAALLVCAGCGDSLTGPTPKLANDSTLPVAPAIACGDQRTTALGLNGEFFSPVPVNIPNKPAIALPSLTLSRSAALDGDDAADVTLLYGGDPTAPSNTSELSWSDSSEMTFTIHQRLEIDGETGRLPSGIYDAQLRNPNGKEAAAKAALAVVDKPAVTEMSPALLCVAQGERELRFRGTSLLKIKQALPSVEVAGTRFDVAELSACTKIAQNDAVAEMCEEALLRLRQDSLSPGLHDVSLTNPATAECHTEEELKLRIVGAPSIGAVVPEVACSLDPQQHLSIRGEGFLSVGAAMPIVKLAGSEVAVASLDECETLETPGLSVQSCRRIELDVDISQFAVGEIAVEVANPDPAGCAVTATEAFHIAGPPMISAIAPTDICSDVVTTFTVTGTGFDRAATAMVDGVASTAVTFVSDSEIRVTMPGLSPGVHGFTVQNAGSCTDTRPAALTVDPSPIVFFADPPVTYGDIPVEVTIFTSGLSAAATQVELVSDGGNVREDLDFTSAGRPNKILARVPAGLTAASWDVVVTNAGGCPGTLPGGLTVTDSLTDALVSGIKPSYASTTEDTAVTISGNGLAAVPRVYLTTAGSSGSARALRAVEVKQGGAALTAVIPSGLTPSAYDLIVVNPDGKVDVLPSGVTITADAPPVITAVTPASLPANASNAAVTLAGTGFKNNLAVELDCLTSSGMRTTVPATEQAPSGGGTSVVVNVTMSNAAPDAVDAGSVCLMRLTNQDGAFFEYSAFSVTNSSLNLSPWQTAPELETARRALSLVAGRPTATSRYIYAIGGDSGANNQPEVRGTSVFDSVEASQVDVFGALSDWAVQRNRLSAPRTGAGAANIGRFVYVLGGHDGTSVRDTLLRAAILDPLAGPEIADLDASLGDGEKGLARGLYYYRVAALRPSDDLDNPGGETLAGELLPVQLPERAEKIALTLKWNEVAGAHGYRIYRSPQPNAAADSLQLLGEITCGAANEACNCGADPSRCRWLDEGATTQSTGRPLPAGSLGVWHAVNGARCSSGDCFLGTPREGLVVKTIRNPANAAQFYLYAFGGRNQAGAYLDTYEVATVTVNADGSQTLADFASGSDTFGVPRADHGAWVMSKSNSNVIASSATPDDVWVYVGGGRTTGDATDRTLEAGELGASGMLNAFVSTDDLNGDLVGFGTGASNDQLYTFGGVDGTSDGTSAQLCDGSGSCAALPDLKPGAFNALGAATTRRMFTGSTQESAFFFVAGGHDGSNAMTTSQRTVQ